VVLKFGFKLFYLGFVFKALQLIVDNYVENFNCQRL